MQGFLLKFLVSNSSSPSLPIPRNLQMGNLLCPASFSQVLKLHRKQKCIYCGEEENRSIHLGTQKTITHVDKLNIYLCIYICTYLLICAYKSRVMSPFPCCCGEQTSVLLRHKVGRLPVLLSPFHVSYWLWSIKAPAGINNSFEQNNQNAALGEQKQV